MINPEQNPPWIQGRQEHQSFQTHQWLPELPLGQGHHAHQGHPIKRVQKGQVLRVRNGFNVLGRRSCSPCHQQLHQHQGNHEHQGHPKEDKTRQPGQSFHLLYLEGKNWPLENIHALQGVHGVQHRQAHHESLSFPPHQKVQGVPVHQLGPDRSKKILRNFVSRKTLDKRNNQLWSI